MSDKQDQKHTAGQEMAGTGGGAEGANQTTGGPETEGRPDAPPQPEPGGNPDLSRERLNGAAPSGHGQNDALLGLETFAGARLNTETGATAAGEAFFTIARIEPSAGTPPSDQQEALARLSQALEGVLAEIDLHRDEAICAPLDNRIALIVDGPRAELLARASERLGRSQADLMLLALDRFLDGEV